MTKELPILGAMVRANASEMALVSEGSDADRNGGVGLEATLIQIDQKCIGYIYSSIWIVSGKPRIEYLHCPIEDALLLVFACILPALDKCCIDQDNDGCIPPALPTFLNCPANPDMSLGSRLIKFCAPRKDIRSFKSILKPLCGTTHGPLPSFRKIVA
ncbi:hypothetical protein LMG31506_00189 [Cupriavidus yeoncheonensis]|uniref:Uncharacterized protein n=1 Tax=Cupriavidus yeoncheonensis TaxID=1462994 RepID=A0A916IQH9_9BURK|nr:hypothetical protein LMG31506_00189 [Cupriavidus yeoncheonensis]